MNRNVAQGFPHGHERPSPSPFRFDEALVDAEKLDRLRVLGRASGAAVDLEVFLSWDNSD